MRVLFVTNLCEKTSGFHNISEITNMDCSAKGLDYPLNLLRELSKYVNVDIYSPSLKGYVTTDPLKTTPNFITFLPQKIPIPETTDGACFLKGREYDIIIVYAESIFSYLTNFNSIKTKKVLWFLSAPQQALLPPYKDLSVDLVIKVADKKGTAPFSKVLQERGYKDKWLPFSVDGKRFRNLKLPKIANVGIIGNFNPTIYPLRIKALEYFLAQKIPLFINPVYGEDYVRVINQSRIFLTCSGTWKFPVMKYFEAPACGTLLMADEPMDADVLGFVTDKTYAMIDEATLVERFGYYTTHVKEAEEVAQAGEKLVRERHTDEIRARELYEILERV